MRLSFFFLLLLEKRNRKAKKEESRALVLELFHKPIKSPWRCGAVVEGMFTFRAFLGHWEAGVSL